MDLTEYRAGASEQARVADLLGLLPEHLGSALDVGARDGYIARLLAGRAAAVTALDLTQPEIDDPRIRCVQGDASALEFADGAFDLVLCAEVLEHLPGALLGAACAELSRVAREYVLIGVPYRQDLRTDRTTCARCGKANPPWAHVNRFDEQRLRGLFPQCEVARMSFVGRTREGTNFLSALLMELAGNPFGTYDQEEPCIHCGGALGAPRARSLFERGLTRAAVGLRKVQSPFIRPRPKWIHVLFRKRGQA